MSTTAINYSGLKTGKGPASSIITLSLAFSTGYLIAVAYSAAVGGMATLVGTGPNIFVKGFIDEYVTRQQILNIILN